MTCGPSVVPRKATASGACYAALTSLVDMPAAPLRCASCIPSLLSTSQAEVEGRSEHDGTGQHRRGPAPATRVTAFEAAPDDLMPHQGRIAPARGGDYRMADSDRLGR